MTSNELDVNNMQMKGQMAVANFFSRNQFLIDLNYKNAKPSSYLHKEIVIKGKPQTALTESSRKCMY